MKETKGLKAQNQANILDKILICSSEESTRESLKLILGDHYNLILIEKIEMYPEVAKNAKIQTLILDIDKQTQIQDAIASLKSAQSKLKIIIVAGYKQEKTALEAVKAGATDYIVKPFKSDKLLSICE